MLQLAGLPQSLACCRMILQVNMHNEILQAQTVLLDSNLKDATTSLVYKESLECATARIAL